MKTQCRNLARLALVLSLAIWMGGSPAEAQEAPTLEIALYPGIRVTGGVGTTYIIESKIGVEADLWLTRGWIELTTPTAIWMDPVPIDSPRRVYRAAQVSRPMVQTIANMVWVPPGTFVMGSPADERGRYDDEGPQTQVTLTRGFWLGKYEVTVGEYLAVMGSNVCVDPANPGDLDRPLVCVSWDDAAVYCQNLTEQEWVAGRLPAGYAYRLPTEAEWEYACRAGTTTRYSFGDALECPDGSPPGCGGYCTLGDSYMWWCGNYAYGADLHRVGQKLPNPWGIYDMHGNVFEWCRDWRSGHLSGGSVVDPAGPSSGPDRVIRGGSWYPHDNSTRFCRSAYRRGLSQASASGMVGFRVVLALGQ